MKSTSRVEQLKNDILSGPIVKTVLMLGWPVILDNLLHMLYNLTDTYWLGKLGPEAVSAPTLAFPIDFLIISLGFGFAIAGVSLVSQHTGAGNSEDVSEASSQVISFMLVSSIVLSVIGYVIAPFLLGTLMGAPEDVYPMALNYARIIFAGMPMLFVFFGARSLLRGIGDMVTPMLATGISVALNAILDPILIFGLWWFPRLEVAGAALTTIIVRGIATIALVVLLFSGKLEIKLHLHHFILKARWVKQILKIGLPSGIGQVGTAVGFTLLLGLVSRLGVIAVSAYGIGQRIIGLLNAAIWGFSSPLTTMIGQNLGAQQQARASRVARRTYALSFSILTIMALVIFSLRYPLFNAFIDDPEVIELGARFISIYIWSVPFLGIFFLARGIFRGSGHTRPEMIMSWVRIIPFQVGISYLLAFGAIGLNLGTDGIWFGLFITNILSGIMAFGWYLSGFWKKRRIKEKKPKEPLREEVKESAT